VADDTGIVRLDTVVAPTLFARGLHPTGTIETGPTQPSSLWCGHFKLQLYASWDLERQLASSYGWTFGSHTKTDPDSLAKSSALTPQQVLDEPCGAEQTITAQRLQGAQALFAWPNHYLYLPAMPDVQGCFDFNRPDEVTWVSDRATVTQPPYQAPMRPVNGGTCNDPSAPCFTSTFPHVSSEYTLPADVISMLDGMTATQWTMLQTYIFVTGSRAGRWDCTNPAPIEHWTDGTEHSCWYYYL